VRIGGKDGHLLRRSGEYDVVRIRTKVNLAAHERIDLCTIFASVNESDAAWQQGDGR